MVLAQEEERRMRKKEREKARGKKRERRQDKMDKEVNDDGSGYKDL